MNHHPFNHLVRLRKPANAALSLFLAVSFGALQSADAAQHIWNASSGNWDVIGNWEGGLPTSSGTAVINDGTASLSVGVSGTYQTLRVGSVAKTGGAIQVNGGYLTGGTSQLGNNAEGSGTATVTSGTWNTGNFSVGHNGTGRLTVQGGYVSSLISYIGDQAGSSGTVTVTGGTWNSSNASGLKVGRSGTGTLNVEGGLVSTTAFSVAEQATSHGAASITGGTLRISGLTTIGWASSSASLTIDGGLVSSAGNVFIADQNGSNGTVTLTSGTWNQTGSGFHVGAASSGTLAIESGLLSANNVSFGNSSTGDGKGTITSGSLVTTGLSIGSQGKGNLTVNGGYVSTSTSVLGSGAAATGLLTVTSGTVTHTAHLTIAGSGLAAVNLSGGLIHVTGTVTTGNSVGSSGLLNLSGSGVLEAARIRKFNGSGQVNFDGGTLRALANESDFISNYQAGEVAINEGGVEIDSNGFSIGINAALGGEGALTKVREGTVTLGGSNSYSGGTVVTAGTLAAGHNAAVGTGAVRVTGGTFWIKKGVSVSNSIVLEGGALAQTIAAEGSLAATRVATDGITSASLLAGTASAETTVQASFSDISTARNDDIRLGSAFSLSGVSILDVGTGETDLFVLQLQTDDVTANHLLGWLDSSTDTWVNAVDGNIGGTTLFLGDKTFNVATDFVLGYYGIDTLNGTVLAVLNHNSDFAVIPEPSTWAIFALGAAGLCWVNRRKARLGRIK